MSEKSDFFIILCLNNSNAASFKPKYVSMYTYFSWPPFGGLRKSTRSFVNVIRPSTSASTCSSIMLSVLPFEKSITDGRRRYRDGSAFLFVRQLTFVYKSFLSISVKSGQRKLKYSCDCDLASLADRKCQKILNCGSGGKAPMKIPPTKVPKHSVKMAERKPTKPTYEKHFG